MAGLSRNTKMPETIFESLSKSLPLAFLEEETGHFQASAGRPLSQHIQLRNFDVLHLLLSDSAEAIMQAIGN